MSLENLLVNRYSLLAASNCSNMFICFIISRHKENTKHKENTSKHLYSLVFFKVIRVFPLLLLYSFLFSGSHLIRFISSAQILYYWASFFHSLFVTSLLLATLLWQLLYAFFKLLHFKVVHHWARLIHSLLVTLLYSLLFFGSYLIHSVSYFSLSI